MAKKHIKKGILIVCSLIVLVLLAWGAVKLYKSLKEAYLDPFNAIPENAAFIIKTTNIPEVWNDLIKNNDLYNDLLTVTDIAPIFKTANQVDSIIKTQADISKIFTENDFYLCIYPDSLNTFSTLFLLKYTKLQDKTIEHFIESYADNSTRENYKNIEIQEFKTSAKEHFKYYMSQGILAGSYNTNLLKKSVDQLKSGKRIDEEEYFKSVEKTSGKNASISIFANYKSVFTSFKSCFAPEYITLVDEFQNFGQWVEFDLNIRKKLILFNGYSSYRDTSNFLQTLSNENQTNTNLFSVMPENTVFFASLGYSESSKYLAKYKMYCNKTAINTQKTGVDTADFESFWTNLGIHQISLAISKNPILQKTQKWIYATPTNFEKSREAIISYCSSKASTTKIDTSNYGGYTIGNVDLQNSAQLFFTEVFKHTQIKCFALLDSTILFGEDVAEMKNLINDIINTKTFIETSLYKDLSEYTLENYNLFLFFAPKAAIELGLSLFNNKIVKNPLTTSLLKNTDFMGIQFSSSPNNLMMTSAFIKYQSGTIEQTVETTNNESETEQNIQATNETSSDFVKKESKKIWESSSPAEILNAQILIDPSEDYYKVAVIDKAANMTLYDNKGGKLWSIKLKEPSKNEITMVDFYKNGKWQMYFNSDSYIYLIDKLGRTVGKMYPYQFRNKSTNQGTTIDLNNKKDYRSFFINQNRQITCVDVNTNLASNWTTPTINRPANQPILAHKVNGKWILTVIDNEQNISFLNIDGNAAFKLSKQIPKHPNSEIEFMDGANPQWVYMSKTGFIVLVSPEGKVQEKKMNISEIPQAFIFTKTNNGENPEMFVISDKNLHLLNSDFKPSKTFSIPFDSKQQQVSSPERNLILIETSTNSVLYDLKTNTKLEFVGKIKVKRVNNKILIASFQKSKLTLFEK